jgi:hypothetical protein
MKRYLIAALAGTALSVGTSVAFAEDGHAGPEEVIAKVRQAAALLSAEGAAGLDAMRGSDTAFMWKDTYVFVVDCAADRVMANPAFPEREGGWIEYIWLKPDGTVPRRKISYVMSVDGQPYQVGAGIYHPSVSLEELVALTAPE